MSHLEEALRWPLEGALHHMQRRIMARSTYFGIQTWQSPVDFWVTQEILWEVRPDVVVEIGTHRGGHLLALAHLLDALGGGRVYGPGLVIGVDSSHAAAADLVRDHPKIQLVEGDAVAVVDRVVRLIGSYQRVLVIEDSAHTRNHTRAVLEAYAPLVTQGSYLIVQDTICHHGLAEGPAPGPWEAVAAFLAAHPEWESDRSREDFLITWHPTGYLRRKA